jgi:hypothetical protein
MFTNRFLIVVAALAALSPLTGCRNTCCKSNSVSRAPACCPTAPPPPSVLPPGI